MIICIDTNANKFKKTVKNLIICCDMNFCFFPHKDVKLSVFVVHQWLAALIVYFVFSFIFVITAKHMQEKYKT